MSLIILYLDDGNSAIFVKSVINCIRIKLFDEKNRDFFFPRRKSIFPRNFSRQNSQKSIYAQRAFSRQITPCSSRYVL